MKAKPDWNSLWRKTAAVYTAAEMPRMRAVLDNFKNDKERILRALGIISEADVLRVKKQLEGKKD
jgi:hypothetical protein